MDLLSVIFPVSGVKTNILLPPLVAMVISFFTSMGGISGAFLLLPFQMSFLNYTAPSVSGTNHVFNIVAIPSGVYRYIKEGRMAWPLTWVVVIGTLPGVFIGYYVRVFYLPDPKVFKLFVGCVLMYIGIRLLKEFIVRKKSSPPTSKALDDKFKINAGISSEAVVKTISLSIRKIEYEFWGERFSFKPVSMFIMSFVVGIIGGAYGIGGGSIIAPFCVAIFHLPVYTIAGAALMGTFITSLAGAIFFSIIPAAGGVSANPDWLLGILFGIGGFVGMYLGAKTQKHIPQKIIKLALGAVIVFLASNYIIQFF
ncbi:sulfite exporter TauE/SafE family protein [Candidatus Magnetominusculus dajiuhuensis]|uniref:sulfite exporter TauE/SafE family protein n=1 Tax=Candidatus Magnetominusculus dajiuhuensis TaxID=3137712 RepID=UPI003B42E6A9